MMLRKAVASSSASRMAITAAIKQQQQQQQHKTLVTSAQKRALNKEQLAGKAAKPAAAAASKPKADAAPAAGGGGGAAIKPASTATAGGSTGGSAPASGGGGGGGGMLPVLGLAIAGAGGAAYYYDMIPSDLIPSSTTKEQEPPKAVEEVAKPTTTPAPEPDKTPLVVESTKEEEEEAVGNKVTQINVPQPDYANRPPQIVPPVIHDPSGSRVDIETFFRNYIIDVNIGEEESAEKEEEEAARAAAAAAEAAAAVAEKEEVVVIDTVEQPEQNEEVVVITPDPDLTIITTPTLSPTEQELLTAHKKLRANLNESFLQDLETLTMSELKIRVVQLVSEMEERTKWEAVRLKEFLSMKEKETADKYLEAMQKQRHEFEDHLTRRLRELEDALTRSANATIQAKEDSIQTVLADSLEAQQQEHEAILSSTIERITAETRAELVSTFGNKLSEEKAGYSKDLKEKVDMIEDLVGRLESMERALEVSRSFESGSQKAHRISAAALALVEKMEGSSGAAVELAALKASAGEDGVIAAALSKIPSSAVKVGVPTLSELQAKFDKVHSVCREAALVPKGRIGLEGQLLGILFAKLTFPASPDAPIPPSTDTTAVDASPSTKDNADYILAKAQKHVQLGDLECALDELDKLKGQAAFTVKDWKKDALDRISVEKALKVIKMECALMNENMSGGSSAA